MNQPSSIAAGYTGSADTSSDERPCFWPSTFGRGEALCVLAEGPDCPWLMGTSLGSLSPVSSLTKEEVEGAEPALLAT